MARLVGPDEGSREVKTINGGGFFKSKANRRATLYSDSGATTLADVLTYPGGATISGSIVDIDGYSMLPLVQFPDGVDTLYVVVDGGPAWPIYARTDDRIDSVSTSVTAEATARAAGDSSVTTAAAADATTKANAAQAAATSAAATDATTKANAAQAAAIAAAATDATTKANAAQSAAISAAASDATTKVAAEATARAAADALKVAKGDLLINVRDYGAVGDGRRVADAAMTSASATLTSATAAFTAGDIGKKVIVWHAGTTTNSYTAGIKQQLVTTISSVTNSTTATLAATASATVSGARAMIATDDGTAIASAVAALSANGELHFPQSSGFYYTTSSIVVPYDGVTVSGASTAVEVHLSHRSYCVPLVDAIDRDDVTVRNIKLVSEDGHIWTTAQVGATPYRGDGQMLNHTGVWCNGNRLTVENVRTQDFENGVYLSPWSTSLSSFAMDGNRTDCLIKDLDSEDEFCAILALATIRLKARNIYKRGYVSLYDAPGHALYHSGDGTAHANYPSGLYGVDCDIRGLSMVDDTTSGGGTLSLKYMRGGRVRDLYARNNPLLYSVQLQKVSIGGLVGVDMTMPAAEDINGQNFICVDSVTDDFGTTDEVDVFDIRANIDSSHVGGGCVDMFFHGENIRLRDIELTTYRDSGVSPASSQFRAVDVWGTGMRVENMRVRNAGPNDGGSSFWPLLIGSANGSTDVEFVNLAVENWRYVARVNTPYVTDLKMRYNPAAMVDVDNRTTTAPITNLGGTFANLRLQLSQYTMTYTVSGAGQTIVPCPAFETTTQIDVSTNDAFTVGAPAIAAKPYSGTAHRITIRNASGTDLGTITWNAAWSLRSTFTAPPNGHSHTIDFAYDGTVWRETGRSFSALSEVASLNAIAANALTTGEIVPERFRITGNTIATTSQTLYLAYFTADKSESITTLTAYTGSTAAGATPTLCRFAVYSVAANGDLTLTASSTNDTSLFMTTTNAAHAKALSATWSKVVGTRYAVGLLIDSGATMPNFHGWQMSPTSVVTTLNALAPVIAGRVTGQSDLPASVNAASVVGGQTLIAIRMS